MHVMHLVHHAVETEWKKTKNADQHAVEFIQATTLSEQTVRSFVKTDEQSMHQMCTHQDQRDGEPEPPPPDRRPDRGLGQGKRDHQRLKRHATYAVLVVQLRNWFGRCREAYHFNSLKRRFAFRA